VRRFIDTPVKRYSSGMQVRLGFAIAAHLAPEVLLVDEVLAVGDAEFQRQCIGKMKDAVRSGRTVLFVSHNMAAVTSLCDRVIWLDQGRVKLDGAPHPVVASYLSSGGTASSRWKRPAKLPQGSSVRIDLVEIVGDGEGTATVARFDQGVTIRLRYCVIQPLRDVSMLLRIIDEQGNIVFTTWDTDATHGQWKQRPMGHYESFCTIPPSLLRPGCYTVTVGALSHHIEVRDRGDDVLSFQVSSAGYGLNPGRAGVITPVLRWEVKPVATAIS